MKYLYVVLFALSCILGSICYGSNETSSKHAISYEGGDRFGDRLLIYSAARYLSYFSSVPFLYRHFANSDKLQIEYMAKSFVENVNKYQRVLHINSGKSLTEFFQIIRNPSEISTLFILDFFPVDISEWDRNEEFSILFNIPWTDPGFSDYLKKSLQPKIEIPDFTLKNILNVAIHVRTLSGTDTMDTSAQYLPLKHPTTDYHIRQLKKVYDWNLNRPIHVFLFTDSKEPKTILDLFKSKFRGSRITFNIQELENPDVNYVVQDFFAMQKFDVLIATQSNYSAMASRLSNYDMIIFPIHKTGAYPNFKIDRVQILSEGSDWFPFKFNLILREKNENLNSYF